MSTMLAGDGLSLMRHPDVDSRQTALALAIEALEGHREPPRGEGATSEAIQTLRRMLSQPAERAAEGHDEQEEPDLPRDWGRLLRQRREAVGLTRTHLAKLAGISEATMRNLETGRRPPTRHVLTRL